MKVGRAFKTNGTKFGRHEDGKNVVCASLDGNGGKAVDASANCSAQG
jgi:hypothetical protein